MQREHHKMYCYPFHRHRYLWGRRFLTQEEQKELKKRYQEKKIQWLQHYKESLEKELKGVQERLEELQKEKE